MNDDEIDEIDQDKLLNPVFKPGDLVMPLVAPEKLRMGIVMIVEDDVDIVTVLHEGVMDYVIHPFPKRSLMHAPLHDDLGEQP